MFKDFVSADLPTFFSASEFCETADINGVDMDVLIDTGQNNRDGGRNGTYLDRCTLYAKALQYGVRPVIDEIVSIKGDSYVVMGCKEAYGVYEITLEAVSG